MSPSRERITPFSRASSPAVNVRALGVTLALAIVAIIRANEVTPSRLLTCEFFCKCFMVVGLSLLVLLKTGSKIGVGSFA
jgi:hypothetical protein